MLPELLFNSLSTNFTKWSNTLKQFVSNLPTNCLSVFGNFVGLALKGLINILPEMYFLLLTMTFEATTIRIARFEILSRGRTRTIQHATWSSL